MTRENKSYKIVVDTNIWISFLMGKCLAGLHQFIYSGKLVVFTCEEQIIELNEVLSRPKLRKYFTRKIVNDFFELFEESTVIIDLKTISNICRDPKDNYLVSLSLDSDSDYLLTGDKDLIELEMISRTKVVTYKMFENILDSEYGIKTN